MHKQNAHGSNVVSVFEVDFEGDEPVARDRKVIRVPRRRRINVGLLMALFIAVYLIVNFIMYLNKEQISVYQVIASSVDNDVKGTALILRNEEVVRAETSGYINYYVNEYSRVGRNDVVYTIDETGHIYQELSDAESSSENDYDENAGIMSLLYQFHASQERSFEQVYTLKNALKDEIMQVSGENMLSSLENVLVNYGSNSNFIISYADESGIVSYRTDGYEGKTADNVTMEDFDNAALLSTHISPSNASLIGEGTPVYKLIPDEEWSVVIPVTQEQYKALENVRTTNITFAGDGLEARCNVHVFAKDGAYFAQFILYKYMIRYVNLRYVDITVPLDGVEGLKIPKTAAVEKRFFRIPLAYFTSGGDTTGNGLVRLEYDKDGNEMTRYYDCNLYDNDGTYGYISADGIFEAGNQIMAANSRQTFTLGETATYIGVYNVNKGYAIFRRIEILKDIGDYYIVSSETEQGLAEYDHIVQQGELVREEEIIY